MNKYQILCIVALLIFFTGCVTTNMYRHQKAQTIGCKIAFEDLKIKNDILQKHCDSLVFVVDSLQVELEK